jgi:alpha-1,2-mannosyltransferase
MTHDAEVPVRAHRPASTLRPVAVLQWSFGVLSVGLALVIMSGYSHADQMDIGVYRMGGQHVFGSGLYSVQLHSLGQHLLFTYTPLAALLFWPLAHRSTFDAQRLWDLIDLFCLITLIAVSIRAARGTRLRETDWRYACMATGPMLFLYPVRSDLALGQINLLLDLMIVCDLTCTLGVGRRRVPRGVLLGLTAAIKLTPLVFIPFLFFSRQRTTALRAAGTFLLGTAAMFVVAPSASWLYWSKDAWNAQRIGSPLAAGNQSMHAVLLRMIRSTPVAASRVSDVLVVVALVGGIALAVTAARRSSFFLGLLVCSATGLLVSPVSWWHHYVWIIPLGAWLAFGSDRPASGRWWAAALATFALLLPITPESWFVTSVTHGGVLWSVWANAYALGAIAFLFLVAIRLRRLGRSPLRVGV